MILEILFALFAATVGYILVGYFIHLMRLKEYPPGPWPLPIIGNLHLIGNSQSYKSLNKLAKTYGPVMSFSFGTQRIVVIQGIREAKEMLVTKGQSFAGKRYFRLQAFRFIRNHFIRPTSKRLKYLWNLCY